MAQRCASWSSGVDPGTGRNQFAASDRGGRQRRACHGSWALLPTSRDTRCAKGVYLSFSLPSPVASSIWQAMSVGLAITYGSFTACAFVSILFAVRVVRETRGTELEDMVG